MQEIKTITAVVPVYNVELYIEECLVSIVNQSIPFDEVILVNDGSTDNSEYICRKYCNTYDNFKLINQENQGLSAARNVGIKNAKSDYIVFIDSDDYIRGNTVRILKNKLTGKELDLLCYNADIFTEKNVIPQSREYIRGKHLYGQILSGIDFFDSSFPDDYMVSACIGAYRKSFLNDFDITFPKGIYFEDIFFYLQVVCNAKKVMCVPEKLYVRRYRKNSIMTGKWDRKKKLDLITVYSLCWEYIRTIFLLPTMQKLFRPYIAMGMVQIFDRVLNEEETNYTFEMKRGLNLFFSFGWKEYEEYTFCELSGLIIALRQLKEYPDLICAYYENYGDYEVAYKNIKELFFNKLIDRLNLIPFREKGKHIGIYGIGKHTACLLGYYQRYIGNIEADTYFIVSDSKQTKIMDGKKIISYNEIENKNDIFLISSKIYQNEMLTNLENIGVKDSQILKLYGKEDFCDLVMIDKIMAKLD